MSEIIEQLIQKNQTKILMVVLDGLGGLPLNGKTELEAAKTPNLDSLAKQSAIGLHIPVSYGITPGSGPGHLGIFGYDPLKYQIGRGVLEALGLGLKLTPNDIALRGNYATKKDGLIVDRRAGRPPTEESRKLTEALQKAIPEIDGVEIIFAPGMEHRFAAVMRFPEALPEEAAEVSDADPQKEDLPPVPPKALNPKAEQVAEIARKLIDKAEEVLKDQPKANTLLLRGFSKVPHIPGFMERFGLKALAVAVYPMYRGLASLVGMDTPALQGDIKEQLQMLKEHWHEYDFFFVHVKKVDSYGEDGNFEAKVKKIEEFDSYLPEFLALEPDVLIITGDHSTPAVLKSHSWHPVPLLIKGPYVLGGTSDGFSERECLKGELGILPAIHILPIALANAGRLKKFGA
ncbi:MAG: 2,3-bisphosphoglycerate-independent phosphoglycerate mutase [Nitrospirae bacterium]|nr:MAG: 2,3-bisphosphoglycerate-independent phosphoglycerate mutase [Nitrospirota bacterium]